MLRQLISLLWLLFHLHKHLLPCMWCGQPGSVLSPDPRQSAEESLRVRDGARSDRRVRVHHQEKRACLQGRASEGAESSAAQQSQLETGCPSALNPGILRTGSV